MTDLERFYSDPEIDPATKIRRLAVDFILTPEVFARKARLFAVALCRMHGEYCESSVFVNAVHVAERFADGEATDEERSRADKLAYAVCNTTTQRAYGWVADYDATHAATRVLVWLCPPLVEIKCTRLLCNIFGPFHPVTFKPEWRTADVLALANAAYRERMSDRSLDPTTLAVLADALEDVGDMAELLVQAFRLPEAEKCRRCAGHGYYDVFDYEGSACDEARCNHCDGVGMIEVRRYRGFWPLDLVLGKHE